MEERRVAVVIEDDEDIRGLLVALFTQSGFDVHETSKGVDGVRMVEEESPDIVTVDLGLPDIDGYEVARRIRLFSDAYLLMLTARSEEIDALMGLDAGADDYVIKPFRPRELRARVEALMRRPRKQPEVVTPRAQAIAPVAEPPPVGIDGEPSYELNGLQLFPRSFEVSVEGEGVTVTPTEFILLKTLLASKRVVRSKAELFRVLRDEDPDSGTFVSMADERTIEVHLGNLRRKLGDDPATPRWIETVRGVGYRSAGTPVRTGSHD
ncbi:response regulator transcription factor [Tessaracoccus oleiagri]|uniref:DNA-binding response regulator, OmpR family, contains REC and winged-helix (WHTH) domain n=1 Tax=Tessaracoccus oleiagri TaxID=686624 RepID=A0A1G9KND1_9ACTN|nr:response regulator transcription factor [Tessaracoccus oleiagri]SDL51116.1 DNA-binding response regulator, OmpR family, contains REC and winged-helix (wHTH) domain [Tessaracoccus oleiagri]